MTIYTWGSQVKVEASFYDEEGVLADPTNVTFTTLAPDMTLTDYAYLVDAEVTRVSAGVYRLTVTLDAPGTWRFRAEGGGALTVAIESQPIPVADSPFYEQP